MFFGLALIHFQVWRRNFFRFGESCSPRPSSALPSTSWRTVPPPRRPAARRAPARAERCRGGPGGFGTPSKRVGRPGRHGGRGSRRLGVLAADGGARLAKLPADATMAVPCAVTFEGVFHEPLRALALHPGVRLAPADAPATAGPRGFRCRGRRRRPSPRARKPVPGASGLWRPAPRKAPAPSPRWMGPPLPPRPRIACRSVFSFGPFRTPFTLSLASDYSYPLHFPDPIRSKFSAAPPD